jgi:hypothetical protein
MDTTADSRMVCWELKAAKECVGVGGVVLAGARRPPLGGERMAVRRGLVRTRQDETGLWRVIATSRPPLLASAVPGAHEPRMPR